MLHSLVLHSKNEMNAREFTCHLATQRSFSHIDLAYVSSAAQWRVTSVQILPRGISNHAFIAYFENCRQQEELDYGPEGLKRCQFWITYEDSASPLTRMRYLKNDSGEKTFPLLLPIKKIYCIPLCYWIGTSSRRRRPIYRLQTEIAI